MNATTATATAKLVSDDVAALRLAVAAARLHRRGRGAGGPRPLLPPPLSFRPPTSRPGLRAGSGRPRQAQARAQRTAAAVTSHARPSATGLSQEAGATSTGTIRPVTIAFWTLEEEARLVRGLRDGLTIDDLAAAHQRTPTAILARAARMTPEETSHLKREQRLEWLREQLLTDRDYDWAAALATTCRRQHAEVLALAPRTGAIWTPAEDEQVRAAIHAGSPTSELAGQLKRSAKSTARRVRDLRQDTSQRDTSQPDAGTPPATSTAQLVSRTPRSTSGSTGRSTTAASVPTRAATPSVERTPAAAAAAGSAHGKPWAQEETFTLLEELRQGMTVDAVAAAHGRSARAINGRAAGILTQLTGRKHALSNDAAEQLQARLTQSSTTTTASTTTASTTTPEATALEAATTSSPLAAAPTDLEAADLARAVLGATELPSALTEGEQR